MRDLTSANFGLLIAFVLPGFVLLWGMEPYSSTISGWFHTPSSDGSSLGGFLYVTVASVATGQFISTVRWLTVDQLMYLVGVPRPKWNFRQLRESVDVFDRLVEIHYRFYQWHSNSLVALNAAVILRWSAKGFRLWQLVTLLFVSAVLFFGARDTLWKYHTRVEALLDHR